MKAVRKLSKYTAALVKEGLRKHAAWVFETRNYRRAAAATAGAASEAEICHPAGDRMADLVFGLAF